jgi:hypothetical protein
VAISVTVDDVDELLTAVASGHVQAAEIFAFVATHRVGRYRTYRLLFDAREAEPHAGPEDVQTLADRISEDTTAFGQRGATAIVARGRALEFARQYEALCQGAGVHVIRTFVDLDEAEAWLATQ